MNDLATYALLGSLTVALIAGAFFAIWYRVRGEFVADDPDWSSFLNSDPQPFDHLHCDQQAEGLEDVTIFDNYKTESGLEVVVLTVQKPGTFPVVGYLTVTGALLQWDRYGRNQNFDSSLNLVRVAR